MNTFIIATHNPKKLKELSRILQPLGIEAVTADAIGISLTEAEETGSTFEENAWIKAASACRETGMPAVADDSGLMVDALDGAPGVYSARYAGEGATDADRNITYDPEGRPGVSALLTTAALCTGRAEADIAAEIGDGGSGTLKKYVTESVNAYLAPIRERREELLGDMGYIEDVLHEGNRRANEIANATLDEVRETMGMVY